MCGESGMPWTERLKRRGSPPHVWGKLDYQRVLPFYMGITPTCVGKALKDPSIGAIFKLQEHVF